MITYTLEVKGRVYKYQSLELARAAAADVYKRTGVILGIQAMPTK